jgi:hypothetical protein
MLPGSWPHDPHLIWCRQRILARNLRRSAAMVGRGDVQGPRVLAGAGAGKVVRRMETEQLVCPHCHESVRDAGVVKVETGLTQVQAFYYHPHAQCFMFDDRTEQSTGAATQWQCRACRGALPREIMEYIDQHAAW